MLTYAGLFSENRSESNPFIRLSFVKKFFSIFKIIKFGEYCGIDTAETFKVQKAVEKAFSVPDAIVAGMHLCGPSSSYWKRIGSSISLIGSGSDSLMWINSVFSQCSKSFLSSNLINGFEIMSSSIKLLGGSWKVVDYAIKLFSFWHSCQKTPRRCEIAISLTFSLVVKLIKLFASLLSIGALMAGIVLSPILLVVICILTLGLSIISRFFKNDLAETIQKDPWERLVWL